ncbi:MAG: hypothetical protein EU541_04425 [Promethearchaeota archaeon]|nr:MAG: hypothetical protein EU541_04425 [Candidatus Lokiarchaeota archaeon]
MTEESPEDWSFFKTLVKKYWYMLFLFILGIIGAILGALFTLFFIITNSTVGGMGSWTIADFSLGTVILLLLWVFLWELLIVGLPVVAYFGIIVALWWVNLPEDEKIKLKEQQAKEKTTTQKVNEGGGVFGFIVFLTFLILVWINGNLFTPFSDLPYTYWIIMGLSAIFWLFIVIGIPILIVGLIYLCKKWKEW